MGRIRIRRERPEREWSATEEEKARGGLWEMKEEAAVAAFRIGKGRRVCHSGWGPFSLAIERLMVHLALATDGSTLNMNIYSDRH